MIRRLVAYLYLGDYDPCNEVSIKAFGTIKQHATTAMPAPERHLRKTMFATSQALDECACLAPRKVNSEHQQDKASAYSTVGTLKDSVQVEEPLTIHATMYALADKYQVAGLGDLARDKFEKTLYHHSNSEDFVNAVEIAYTSTPESNRGLRLAVLRAFRICFQVDVTEIPGFEAKLETIDQLSFLLIKSWPTKTEPARSGKPVLPNSTASAAPFSQLFAGHSSSTPATGSGLFANLPSRTPSGLGSSTPVLNTAGNAQTSQTNGFNFGRPAFSTNTR